MYIFLIGTSTRLEPRSERGLGLGLGLECALLHCDLIRRDCDVDAIDVIDLDVAIELLMPYTWI